MTTFILRSLFCSFLVWALLPYQVVAQSNYDVSAYTDEAQQIIDAALQDGESFKRLTYFTDTFGHRLSGSESLEQSIDWILQEMQRQPLDRVTTQKVMVPHWVRGEESLSLVSPRSLHLPMLGLGGSVGTPPEGIQAEVLVVNSFDELEAKAQQAKGNIVLYNVPFTMYGETVQYRLQGAIASLVRSVGPYSMQTPHAGTSNYEEGTPKIPHAAITSEHAAMLERMQDRGQKVTVNLSMEAETRPDKLSRNIIAEIKGSEKPEEIVVMGGHIDSWDVGQGVMDDAGGCFAAWEALLLMKKLGLKPKRTVRVVMWTNEENGLRGATAYRDSVKADGSIDDHILAIESDSGVFEPRGFGFTGSDNAFAMVSAIGQLLEPVGSETISRGGGGADIGPIMREGVPGMGLQVDGSRYFWYHHTAADTIDKLDEEEYQQCIATMAIMAFVVADLPHSLPRK
ncbi:M20/M25/M40 family metallo-hydrolase [Fodinibius salsisoli]|uniref:Carboxypeptidase Q n=1 Tax=Fodinibius salsisoli TaxID=2820877 RepID=A0ABT3PNI2_9BACT|nr:M20/M25/M40 family metallo-hydrolase [Fodinibius salsisoli]MCW9707415.1 M20/M25/M40 family metallo-hydrolase [Fodinibius salsisoli]